MRIELEDTPQAGIVSLTQAMLRCVLGGIMLLHGLDKLLDATGFAARLAPLGLAEVDMLVKVACWVELATAAGLILGRFTRLAALLVAAELVADATARIAMDELWQMPVQWEAGALMLAASCFFIVVGSGPYGLDQVLRRRARLRAIAKDEIWSRPPYVTHR